MGSGGRKVRATARYGASEAYFSYKWAAEPASIEIEYSGSGEKAEFRCCCRRGLLRGR
ncbi:hypothetical protein [Paludibaculum fermentans]|uniref:Uncharacterized protein n=1 Tax=Paludibaculum fermentans TaxID=1473598 RepID=A0A7S7SIY9_PALFE|nr:hypothetical protein [Paludibaculum fermentans]QOY87517.1 hypothetical protein IRI77_32985 [Paludibaculum fermentans]